MLFGRDIFLAAHQLHVVWIGTTRQTRLFTMSQSRVSSGLSNLITATPLVSRVLLVALDYISRGSHSDFAPLNESTIDVTSNASYAYRNKVVACACQICFTSSYNHQSNQDETQNKSDDDEFELESFTVYC